MKPTNSVFSTSRAWKEETTHNKSEPQPAVPWDPLGAWSVPASHPPENSWGVVGLPPGVAAQATDGCCVHYATLSLKRTQVQGDQPVQSGVLLPGRIWEGRKSIAAETQFVIDNSSTAFEILKDPFGLLTEIMNVRMQDCKLPWWLRR